MNAATEVVECVRISEVWFALGGGPLRRGRGRAFWRDGDGFNVSLSNDKDCWHDFASGDGGGVLDLVQRVRGGTRAEALHFVAEVAGLPLDDKPLSPRRRQVYAAYRHQAGSLAQQCAWWVRASIQELERIKAQANENDDFHALSWSSRELYRMQQAVPSALMARFLNAMRDHPKNTASLVEAGREDEQHAYAVTALIVAMLAKAAGARDSVEAAHAA
jgi:hypothetical protein